MYDRERDRQPTKKESVTGFSIAQFHISIACFTKSHFKMGEIVYINNQQSLVYSDMQHWLLPSYDMNYKEWKL